MKKILYTIMLSLVLVISLSGCNKKEETKESTYQVSKVNNIIMDITNISASGATLTITDSNEFPYVYGEWYKIEKLIDGKWYDVETIRDDYGFNEIAYFVDENNKVKFEINWKWLYGELPTGNYRILKEIDKQYIAVEFTVN